MLKILLDENLSRSTAKTLRQNGFEVLEVRDCGLRGKSDEEIFDFAKKEKAVILTGDIGFGNVLRFPLGVHHGIFVVHFPTEVSLYEINRQIMAAFNGLSKEDFSGNLIILEPGKIRIRRK
ncbi:MAG TPA: DUF5615 family PIN-like protein [Thermodesulfobacteriota bacterium]|nr:DUF5615 family PIN-like protein [Thermodesulfobacteriota bacterium]